MSRKMSKLNVAAIVLAMSFAAHQTFSLNAFATDITGITGNNGVFDINPQFTRGDYGLREYENFTLDQGDIANLIFKYGAENVSKFINLVDNQININGLVNTVRDGQFYNGEAIFISPNGMVVGEHGVLNVGSLSVLTPTAPGMKMFKKGTATLEELGYHGNADVTINGKVLSRGNIGVVARDINIGSAANLIAGGGANNTVIASEDGAADLFTALVNTGASENAANVEFRSYNRDGAGTKGMNIAGNITNYGKGDIVLTNRGKAFTTTGGSIVAHNGDVRLINGVGNMSVASTVESKNGSVYLASGSKSGSLSLGDNADISAKELAEIVHNGSGNTTLGGKVASQKNIYITEKKGDLIINGAIGNAATKGRVVIASNGTGMTINDGAVITNNGQTRVANTGSNGLTINGKFNNTDSLAITNRAGNFTVGETAVITNNNGKLNLTNTSGKFTMAGKVNASGTEALIQNTGADGFDLSGTIASTTDTYVQNTKGDLNITGGVGGTKLVYVGNTGDGGLNISGSGETSGVATQGGRVAIVNMGAKGLTISSDAKVLATGDGRVAVTNRNGKMSVAGKVGTENGNMNLTNVGDGGLEIVTGAVVGSTNGGQLIVQNTGAGGMSVDGTVQSNGQTLIYNKAGNLNIAGKVANSGANLSITNTGEALNVEQSANISNDEHRIYITNKGKGGLDVQGNVTNKGHILLTNRDGGMDVSGTVQSTGANVVLTNSGSKEMNVSGIVKGKTITATGKGSDIVLGNLLTNEAVLDAEKKVVINIENGDLLNAGVDGDLIKSQGRLFIDVRNGSIGEDVVTDNQIGEGARDLTKSINVNVAGGVKAFVTNAGADDVINIASRNADLNVDRIKNANGKVMLLTGEDKNILNASTNLKEYANVNGATVQIISGGSVGTADKALHFRQTDATQQSNVLARKDINLYQRGEDEGEDVNFGVIKSKEGSIKADMIKDGVIENAIAPGEINITSRKGVLPEEKVKVNNKSHEVSADEDYFDF